MGLTAKQSVIDDEVVIQIEGRFDFHMHAEFKDSYIGYPPRTRFVIDLGNTTYLDSSAMGMLLLLREHVGGDTSNIRIIKCTPEVKKALSISNLDKLFMVE